MAIEELRTPIPEISLEAKRELPDFVLEEERARHRLLDTSGIKRPVRPMYAFLRTTTRDLEAQSTTEDMDIWKEMRAVFLKQFNWGRWIGNIAVGNTYHTIGWFSVIEQQAEKNSRPTGVLRCACNLPAFNQPDLVEYVPCPATESVIAGRAHVYRETLGINEEMLAVEGGLGLVDLVDCLVMEVKDDHLSWPPSHRNDMLLADGVAQTFGVSQKKILEAAHILKKRKVVDIYDAEYPMLSLAA
ncbi:MAG TPA: hypothetical protein VLE51_03570 [Candidatus Saccharimonadales bacterium]|nr:hypothetical protein [Candidatus Saccharimonadales bacterium]